MFDTVEEVYANVLPVLQADDWRGAIQFPGRPLYIVPHQLHLPWVAFAVDEGERVQFITFEHMDQFELTPEAVEEHAAQNLRRRPVEWRPMQALLPQDVNLHLAALTGDFYSAEQVLVEETLTQGAELLGAEKLSVGVPRRGILLAADASQGDKAMAAFSLIIANQFHQAETTPISPLMLALEGTDLLGVLDGRLLYVEPT